MKFKVLLLMDWESFHEISFLVLLSCRKGIGELSKLIFCWLKSVWSRARLVADSAALSGERVLVSSNWSMSPGRTEIKFFTWQLKPRSDVVQMRKLVCWTNYTINTQHCNMITWTLDVRLSSILKKFSSDRTNYFRFKDLFSQMMEKYVGLSKDGKFSVLSSNNPMIKFNVNVTRKFMSDWISTQF